MGNLVLAIAINDYDDDELNKIHNCKSDVDSILEVLTENYIIDDVEYIHTKEDTTYSKLHNRLNEYFVNTLEEDHVLLIYAGHGQYNEKLDTHYWQPSDANPTDPSSWLNINNLLWTFNKSDAFHISVISDSCFSGTIFNPETRGGGTDAFESKKSRNALTSGSKEKVSDGYRGKESPFAKTLMNTLKENEHMELPFTILSNLVVQNFSSIAIQTPMFGSLSNSGHDGGSWILRKKASDIQPKISSNKNEYLKSRMGSLYIPLSDYMLDRIKDIEPINIQKIEAVKSQKYEEAAQLRDKVIPKEKQIKKNQEKYLGSMFNDLVVSSERKKELNELEEKVKTYEASPKPLPSKKPLKLRAKQVKTGKTEKTIIRKQSQSIWEILQIIGPDPSHEYFRSFKSEFTELYLEKSVLEMYKKLVEIKGDSKDSFLQTKFQSLMDIMEEILDLEVKLVLSNRPNELDDLIKQKEIETELIKWIN